MYGCLRLGRLIAGAIGLVLEGHPAVAGLRERAHHPRIEFPGRQRLSSQTAAFGLHIGLLESISPQVGKVGHVLRVEQRPGFVRFHPLHEQVRHPIGDIQMVGAARIVAGVVAKFEEGFDIGVPGLQIHAGGAFALAALVDRRDGGVQGLQPGHDAIRETVGGADQRPFGAHPVPGDADAAGKFRQQGDVLVLVVHTFQRIGRRVEQEAARELLVQRARVEQRR